MDSAYCFTVGKTSKTITLISPFNGNKCFNLLNGVMQTSSNLIKVLKLTLFFLINENYNSF